MKNLPFTPAQKIVAIVFLTIFVTAVILSRLNMLGFTASEFTV